MRRLIHKLFQPKWNYEKAEFTETTEVLNNPERGWYHIYPFFVEQKPDLESVSWGLHASETLVLVIINIGAYREQKLDATAMEHIREILTFFKKRSYDMILRITYDHEGNALEREPFFFKVVMEHLEQLTPVLKEFADSIFVYQGMLIGNWGEMHTSRFLGPDKLRQMWGILNNDLSKKTFLAVRRPANWRVLHPDSCGRETLKYDTTGLFDDAIFGSENHLGTFGTQTKENAGWDGLWCREEELEFENQLCKRVPNGGEAVCGENYADSFSTSATVEVLRKMHITYLNQAYDERILNIWKQRIWEEAGTWKGASLYDYIGAHLGYRFFVKDASMRFDKKTEELCLEVEIENSGFANIYQETELWLEQKTADGKSQVVKLDYDIRTLDSGTAQTITYNFSPKDCEFYLFAKRKADGRAIYFANALEETEKIFLGKITGRQPM